MWSPGTTLAWIWHASPHDPPPDQQAIMPTQPTDLALAHAEAEALHQLVAAHLPAQGDQPGGP
jgi:hypothetical protein